MVSRGCIARSFDSEFCFTDICFTSMPLQPTHAATLLPSLQLPVKPDYGSFSGFDHCHWWVGNAKQAAAWFSARFGFQRVGLPWS